MRHTLYLLRHAKSSWDDTELTDRDRPLAARGHRAAPLIGTYMRKMGYHPARIVCSDAQRARDTLDLVMPMLTAPGAARPPVEIAPILYDGDATDLLTLVKRQNEEILSLMLIGHNPTLEDAAGQLIGDDPGPFACALREKYPTAGLSVFSLSGSWADMAPHTVSLSDFAVPRALEADS